MYLVLYKGLGLTSNDLTNYDSPLVAIDGIVVMPTGQVTLPVEVGGRKELVDFIVVHSYSLYTAILGFPQIHSMGAVPSSLHQKVKLPTKQGIAKIREDQGMAWRCQVATIGHKQKEEIKPTLQQLQFRPKDICERLEKTSINLGDEYFQVGASLTILEKVELILFLINNLDVFAWSPYEAPGVDSKFICH